MKTSIFLMFLVSSLAQICTANYTLTDNKTGANYTCGTGSGGGTSPTPTDPNCVPKVTSYCNSNTGYTSTQCFDKATAACIGANTNFATCVSQTSSYCNSNTGYTSTQCFDKALPSCAGNHLITLQLMETVRAHTIQLQKSLLETEILKLQSTK